MKSSVITLFIGIAAWSLASSASAAISLSLEPSSQTIDLGGSASIDLVISGLGDHTSPSLGAFGFFDFDLSYDAAILTAVSVSFGNHLDLGIAGSIRNSDLTTPGAVQLDELSLESEAALNAAQPSSFTRATLSFKGVGVGLGTVNITGGSLSDETGLTSLPFTASNGQIQVVPEVGTSLAGLFLAGMLGVEWLRRRVSTARAAD